MIATIPSATLLGVEGCPVIVEVHVSGGLPTFTIVGLPDAACRESRDRVRAALLSSELSWPLQRITVNLAPSGVRKGGPGLDLPIAVGVLVAAGLIDADAVAGFAFLGELGLDGSVRRIPGLVSLVDAIATAKVVVPVDGIAEAELVGRHRVLGAAALRSLVSCLRGERPWPVGRRAPTHSIARGAPVRRPDLAEVRGQPVGRTALEVAAAGAHHLLLCGPPGAGKTMLANRLVDLLPELTAADALEVTRVYSAAGLPLPAGGLMLRPPMRAPHHGASMVALIGGGTAWLRPGEVSLAHAGVLFLDELGEFPAFVLDALRQPIEEGTVRVCRARTSMAFPARFLLVAATNPCPCGEGAGGRCRCTETARARYERRFSAPLLDRFDLRVMVNRPDVDELLDHRPGETTAMVAERVRRARQLANDRGVTANAALTQVQLEEVAPLSSGASRLLEHKLRAGTLSARGLDRIRRVARTLADLAAHNGPLLEEHVCLALGLRAEIGPGHAAADGAVALNRRWP